MSIEQALAENTAAIRELIARITVSATLATAAALPVVVEKAAKQKVANTDAPKAAVEPLVPETTVAEEVTAAPVEEVEVVTYAVLGKAITDLVVLNRAAAIAVLTKHGVSKATQLKEDQYAAVLADVRAASV